MTNSDDASAVEQEVGQAVGQAADNTTVGQAATADDTAAVQQSKVDTGGGGDGDAVDKAGLLGTADADKEGAEKPAEDDKPEDKAVEYGDFKIAEQLQVDEETMTLAKDTFKEMGLTQEQAQKLIDLQNNLALKQDATLTKTVEAETQKLIGKWEAAVRADEELGGADLGEKMKIARSAATKLGCEDALMVISEARLSSNPAILRLLYRAGMALSEGAYVQGSVVGEKDLVSILYDKSNMK